MQNVRIFEFDNQGYMVSMTQAQTARFGDHDDWLLDKVDRTEFASIDAKASRVERSALDNFRWPTQISGEMVAAAVLRPERMGTFDLFQYTRHLQANGQSAQKYQIQFWKKVFYPLSCLVMVVLALPFAYLHFRSGSVAPYVFGGVMAVADLGGFRKAADACHVSQPSLSAQIAQVEAALGVTVFERNRRQVRVSAAGHAIVAQARAVLVAAGDLV